MVEAYQRGNLDKLLFPELLQMISQRRETGVLRVTHLRVKKEIYFQEGQIIFAKSNDPDERLGELLMRRGRISWNQLEEAASKIIPGKRLGTILVQEGIIKPTDLYHGVIDQVEDIIYGLFEWQEGDYEFLSGELPGKEDITLNISTPDVIAAGMGRIRKWSWIRKGVVSLDTIYRRNEDWPSVVRKMTKTPEVKSLLAAVEHPMSLREILNVSPVSNFETCKLIWAFLVIGAVEPAKEETTQPVPVVTSGEPVMGRPIEFELESSAPTVILSRGDAAIEPPMPPPVPDTLRIEPPESVPTPPPAAETIRIAPPSFPATILENHARLEPEPSLPPPLPLSPLPESEPMIPDPGSIVELPSAGLDLSFSDLADLTDQAMTAEPPPLPVSTGVDWEKKVGKEVKSFNERHRYMFEVIRMEVGSGVGNFISKVLKKISGRYPLVFEGVQINEYGEFHESALLGNIQGNLAEDYGSAFDSLIREEMSLISGYLDKRRTEAIETGYARIVEKQKGD